MSEQFRPISVRTDMALEARDIVRGGSAQEIPGVRSEETRDDGLVITRVEVSTEEAARLLGKPVGQYVTVDVPAFKERDSELRVRTMEAVARELARLIGADRAAHILVVGLGNWNATPDALGPRVVDRLLVTRHLRDVVPEDIRSRMRPVSAVAPGVLGTTGIETVDIIRGIVRETRPDLVVAVDALAARSIARLMASIQIADTGIHPGSGVGNRRHGITPESIGVPVVAIGVPTVVLASGIVLEAVQQLVEQLKGEAALYRIIDEMDSREQRELIEEVIGPRMGDLMVTPKEIDLLINDMADVLAEALNRALQPGLDPSEWA
jgi:spore protease